MLKKMFIALSIIFIALIITSGFWFHHFLYGQYIPERDVMNYLPRTTIESDQSILIYGADSSFATGQNQLSDNTKIYPKFASILLDYQKQYSNRLEGFIHGGDYVSSDTDQQINAFISATTPIKTAGVPIFLVTGNEEGEKGRQKLVDSKILTKVDPYYVQKFNNFTAIILNTEFPLKKGTPQYHFLSTALADAKDKEFMIFMHHPLVTYGFHDNNIVEFKRKRFTNDILKLIAEHKEKIIAVIQSDDHDYQRLDLQGIPLFVSGGLGEGLRATKKGPLTQYSIDGIFHYIQILSNKEKVVISGIRFNDLEVLGEFDRLEIKL